MFHAVSPSQMRRNDLTNEIGIGDNVRMIQPVCYFCHYLIDFLLAHDSVSVMTPNYLVCSGPHYITNDIGSDSNWTHVTYRGVPGAQQSCVILSFCIGSYCAGHVPNWGACYD
jgi:hypothetical protein